MLFKKKKTKKKPLQYPDKFQNMHGCRVVVAPLQFEPYIFFKKNENSSIQLHGIEVSILNAMASKLNFTVDIHIIPSQTEYSKLDGIVFGMVRVIHCYIYIFAAILIVIILQVANGSVNMTMGAFGVTVNRTTFFSSSEPHLALSIHFAYAKGMPLSSMRRILIPFSSELWSLRSST